MRNLTLSSLPSPEGMGRRGGSDENPSLACTERGGANSTVVGVVCNWPEVGVADNKVWGLNEGCVASSGGVMPNMGCESNSNVDWSLSIGGVSKPDEVEAGKRS